MTMDLFGSSEISDFKNSITPGIYEPNDLVDWEDIEEQIVILKPGIELLDTLCEQDSLDVKTLSNSLLSEPTILEIIKKLLAISNDIDLGNKRNLLAKPPKTKQSAIEIANILIGIGISNLIKSPHIGDLVKVSLIAADAPKRRFRITNKINNRITSIIQQCIISLNVNSRVKIADRNMMPRFAQRRVDYLLQVDGVNRIAIASVFQNNSGGRQQRDLTLTYPSLQEELNEHNINLILIADGKGISETPDKVLEKLFSGISACMTIRQAESGGLNASIEKIINEKSLQIEEKRESLETIINSTVISTLSLKAKDLPAKINDAKLSLASFRVKHPELALDLEPGGEALSWRRKQEVELVIGLKKNFDAVLALNILTLLLKGNYTPNDFVIQNNGFDAQVEITIQADSVLPSKLLSIAQQKASRDTIKEIAKQTINKYPNNLISILIIPSFSSIIDITALRKQQRVMAVNVVVLDVDSLYLMATSSSSTRDTLAKIILDQSDLTKVSPFVVNSVTPERMFFGREEEHATMLATLSTNSIALLGGRRIGKTSLMRHVESRLTESGFLAYFGDCQVVKNWSDFGKMATRQWKIKVPNEFKPHHLFDIIEQLKKGSSKRVVLLLDEVDQLLYWDQQHTDNEVTEGFFKACRAISQESLAEFVFSGERTISQKMWNPHSPHWNFSKSLFLQQLSRSASERLLIEPLRILQISIINEALFLSEAWRRTSGHPRLLQYIGDKLISSINTRSNRLNTELSVNDIIQVTENYEYAENYLATYWGQATHLEKLISLLIREETFTPTIIEHTIKEFGLSITREEISDALRMLDLYGIILADGFGYTSKLDWFSQAVDFYGGISELTTLFINNVK
ncbi:hypothetical protein GCM10011375_32470 [Hymenobacter qilianensis]|uniref:ATP-binding protein n=2 Tax=Hymenobacter qilianensis TaxID=1385715 RepID=A0A7H0GT54_9BACT|nr:ATP-binding protein [Hymenobacter qilianensis]QNP51470.1 ATP-binding protein [Hymenobacter qilianensis]GGF74914.1 hypothetical protein GCM10011375_32470 [Hymenobacter qilianensis]